mmetsp:Transcript_2101/g.4512  ORF Transcript_2101/g.4512 Transcript_2101/m.4512 type:complete len:90 (-) Transcript_2101:2754-3023(-)
MFTSTSRRAVRTVFRPRFSRTFAEDAVKEPTRSPGRFSALLSRISSFLVGAGLTALATQYYIFEELREGNKILIEKQTDIEKRLKQLEK